VEPYTYTFTFTGESFTTLILAEVEEV